MVKGLSIIGGIFRSICVKAGHIAAPHLERGREEQKGIGYDAVKQSAARRRRSSKNAYMQSIVVRKEAKVELICKTCRLDSSRRIDTYSSFATLAPYDGYYVARRTTVCSTPTCNPWREQKPGSTAKPQRQRTLLIPFDPQVPFIVVERLGKAGSRCKLWKLSNNGKLSR